MVGIYSCSTHEVRRPLLHLLYSSTEASSTRGSSSSVPAFSGSEMLTLHCEGVCARYKSVCGWFYSGSCSGAVCAYVDAAVTVLCKAWRRIYVAAALSHQICVVFSFLRRVQSSCRPCTLQPNPDRNPKRMRTRCRDMFFRFVPSCLHHSRWSWEDLVSILALDAPHTC